MKNNSVAFRVKNGGEFGRLICRNGVLHHTKTVTD